MSGPSPLQPQGPLFLEALRLVEVAPSGGPPLPALSGLEVKAVLAEIQAQGLLLMLADGRKLTAAGSLPYPPGTTLTFRVQPQADGTTQLQPLRADPPQPPPLLAPLLQGEAAPLLQRLAAPELPAALVPLKALLDRLPSPPAEARWPEVLAPLREALGLPPAAGRTGEATSGAPPEPLPGPRVGGPWSPPSQATLPSMPTPRVPHAPPLPGPEGARPAPLAEALVARGIPPEVAPQVAAHLLGMEGASPDLPGLAQRLLEALAPTSRATPETPEGGVVPPGLPAQALAGWIRGSQPAHRAPGAPTSPEVDPKLPPALKEVLDHLPPAVALRVGLLLHLLPPAGQGAPLPAQDPLAQLLRALLPDLRAALPPPGTAAAPLVGAPTAGPTLDPAQPATWERWLRGSMEALARPESSPAEAPFHRLQGKEGSALFELPLPWVPARPQIELWAERTPEEAGTDPTSRVLLALDLGRTGELRVALQAGPGGTRAQVVAGAEVAAELATLLKEELGEPAPFPVQVRAAELLPPRPRALAGHGLRALG